MRNTTRRALRATATVAGVAALAGTFAGTAFADSDIPGLGGDHNFGGSDSDSDGLGNFGDSDGSTLFDEPGLGNFEMPGMGMGSRGMRTDWNDDWFGGNDNDSDWRDRDGDHCSHSSHSRSRSYDAEHGFQNPMQCAHDNYFKHDDFNILGHNFRTAYQGKSIGSRSFKADNGGLGGMFGDDDYGDSNDGHFNEDSIFSHNDRGTHSDNWGDDDYGYDNDSDGLSGHHIKLPLGN